MSKSETTTKAETYQAASAISDKERALINVIKDSGVVNFEQLGKVVAQVAPSVFNAGVAADDYVAKAYSSVIQIWKVGTPLAGLENIAALRAMAVEVGE